MVEQLSKEDEAKLFEALHYRQNQLFLKSAPLLLDLSKTYQRSPSLKFLLAQNFYDLKNYPESLNLSRQLVEEYPVFEDFVLLYAQNINKGGNPHDAINLMKTWSSENEFSVKSVIFLSELYDQIFDEEQANFYMQEALNLVESQEGKLIFLAQQAMRRNQFEQGLEHYQVLHDLAPENITYKRDLARSLFYNKNYLAAQKLFSELTAENSQDFSFFSMWAYACLELGQIKEAREICEKYLHHLGDEAQILSLMGRVYLREGNAKDAREFFQKAKFLDPENWGHHSNLLYCLNCIQVSGKELLEAHLAAGALIERKCPQSFSHFVGEKEKLRVAFISPDFYQHSVGYFLLPLMREWQHENMDLVLFANNRIDDEMTEQFKDLADEYYSVRNIEKFALAQKINELKIDILIDCAGYTRDSNLDSMAFKPAPIQITYCGYPTGLGMKSIDYRISDVWADPIEFDSHYLEKLIRLPAGFLCYEQPQDYMIKKSFEDSRHVTFGSFNNLTKYNDETIELWSRILHLCPKSNLLLKNHSFRDLYVRDLIKSKFLNFGIAESRLHFISWTKDLAEHFDCYNQVDIALDTFPYQGTTTTCEALWMGVPVVSLLGPRHAFRVSASLFKQLGLEENMFEDPEQYIHRAISLAQDFTQLQNYRDTLRERLLKSDLLNAPKKSVLFQNALFEIYQNHVHKTDLR